MNPRPRPRLGPGLVTIPTYRGVPAPPATDVTGVDPWGDPVTVTVLGVETWTLLLFLSARCEGCSDLWGAPSVGLSDLPGVRRVIVTRGASSEDAAELRPLATTGVPVVMSDEAYRAYRVAGPPFFSLVDGPGARVATEGVAWGAELVADFVRRARLEALRAAAPAPPGTGG